MKDKKTKLNKNPLGLPLASMPEFFVAEEAAKEAGKAVLEVYKDSFMLWERDGEPVTEADMASDKIINKILSNTGYPIISEESLNIANCIKQENVWMVDPLDGTRDFINKTGDFSIMIALIRNKIPILGVIFQPTNDRWYVAGKDGGAYQRLCSACAWEKIGVDDVSILKDSSAVMSTNHLSTRERDFLKVLSLQEVKQKGSCGLKVAEIASGRAEIYFTFTDKIKQWDTAAGYCLINEAGGSMTDIDGKKLTYEVSIINHPKGILVTNGKLHKTLVSAYKVFLK